MLSIDEAIAHAREVANTQRGKSGICLQNGLECEHFSDCLKCAEEHEQLAEWLEELKAIKNGSIPIIHGKAELELHDKEVYNKALDEFIHTIEPRMEWDNQFYALAIEHCIKIAEQLKEGRNNENYNKEES